MPRKIAAFSAALIALGVLAGSAQIAGADDNDESSVVSVHDNTVGVQACHNHVPVNVLGVQVPVQELAASLGLPIASDDSAQRGPDSSCNQDSTGRDNRGSVGRESHGRDADNAPAAPNNDKDKDKDHDHGLLHPLLP